MNFDHPQNRILQPSPIYKLLRPQEVDSIELDRDFATLIRKTDTIRIALESATISSSPDWLILRKITLTTPQGSFNLAGLTPDAVASLESAVQDAKRHKILLDALSSQMDKMEPSLAAWQQLAARDAYITVSDIKSWRESVHTLNLPTPVDADLVARLPIEAQNRLQHLIALRRDPQNATNERNNRYVLKQLADHKTYFDAVESNPLTGQQREAIVHDEENALVIAGAGTGKTSTIVGKTGYILKKQWATPDEILLLAFTVKAADEMRERIKTKIGVDVKVRTFHGLGLEIIGQATGKKPSLFAQAEDQNARQKIVMGLINDLMTDDSFRQNLLAFQSALRRAYKPAWEFKSQSEYTQYLLDVELRALNGLKLRSYEECEIANWLTTHSIPFEYERRYEIDTATPDHRQYKPDFYLPEQKLYIEHWGVDRQENAAPFMDPVRYREKMQWARALHAEHGTTLVETYSWEKQEGVLIINLESKLREHGVEFRPLPIEDALKLLNDEGQIDPLARLMSTFLGLFKSGGYTIENLRTRINKGGDSARANRFMDLYAPIFERYEALLRGRGEIDFDDMIIQARKHVEDASYRSNFRYIIVDEFQDISHGRARLIRALRDQVEGAKLFCVGDDWQSIYRFTGSDISLTTEFAHHLGPTRKTALDRTFRFHDKIAAFSSRFVQTNPSQLRKQLSTVSTSERPGIVVYKYGKDDDPLPSILAEIAAQGAASVFLLGRFNHSAPKDIKSLQTRFPRLKLGFHTAHGSKGLEADYVVILGLSSGKYGFPSEIIDDPVMGMVLADGERFAFAEERRLFYVGLTRAKKRVYLMVDATHPSTFAREILADGEYEKEIAGSASAASDVCPSCNRGRLVKRDGERGVFYGCTNYPICTHTAASCSQCRQGRMRATDSLEALCDACGFRSRVCPRCQTGMLVVRKNKSNGNEFWGCSNFGKDIGSCDHTEPMGMPSK